MLENLDQIAIFKRKLIALFPDEKTRSTVNSILDGYGIESHEQEALRVKLAVLKLAGPDLDKIQTMTKRAKEDFRDIIAWAEYPRQSKKWSIPDGSTKQKLIDADKAEYQLWLCS